MNFVPHSMTSRVYLDNAATSWPKPEAVYQAVDRYLRENGATAGRGVYREAVQADRIVEAARLKIARLINAPCPESIVFTSNCTDALNLAIHGLVESGDRVVTTDLEHNSILRPLRFLQEQRGITVDRVWCEDSGGIDLAELRTLCVGQGTALSHIRLIAITHASNVTGAIQPLDDIGRIAQECGAALLVDAAQSAGTLAIDVQRQGIHLLAASGHKGLLGPLGTGFLYIAPGLESRLKSLRQGGTGTRSDQDLQPTSMPDRYESGNLNVPGIVGLSAGLDYVLGEGVANIHARERALVEKLMAALAEMPGVRLLGPPVGNDRASLIALTIEGYDPRELASLLDSNFGLQVRAGLHCAPLVHKSLNAWPTGTVRLSVGPFTTEEDIDVAIAALREVVAAM